MDSFHDALQTWATVAAAGFGGLSALVAAQALLKTSKAATESQNTNARQGFEQRYTLLLTQHNTLHDAVCKHLESDRNYQNTHGVSIPLRELNNQVDGLTGYFNFLTGHPIISPYMRILYHLLKHIDQDPYIKDKSAEEKRMYSSPLRSYIRNDVLFLIAVNALNVKSERMMDAGYQNYQKMLHRFNFFEHAIFSNPDNPNLPFADAIAQLIKYNNKSVNIHNHSDIETYYIHEQLRQKLGLVFNSCVSAAEKGAYSKFDELDYSYENQGVEIKRLPENLIETPFMTCICVYDNPHTKGLTKALEKTYQDCFSKCKAEFKQHTQLRIQSESIKQYIGGIFNKSDGTTGTLTEVEDLIELEANTPLSEQGSTIISAASASIKNTTLKDIAQNVKSYAHYQSLDWPKNDEKYLQLLEINIKNCFIACLKSLGSSYKLTYNNAKKKENCHAQIGSGIFSD